MSFAGKVPQSLLCGLLVPNWKSCLLFQEKIGLVVGSRLFHSNRKQAVWHRIIPVHRRKSFQAAKCKSVFRHFWTLTVEVISILLRTHVNQILKFKLTQNQKQGEGMRKSEMVWHQAHLLSNVSRRWRNIVNFICGSLPWVLDLSVISLSDSWILVSLF